MAKSTLVTFFFDLTQLEDSIPSTRPSEFYLNNGKNTLSIDNPMVIFCDSTYKSKIEEIRNTVCPNASTVYIEKNIDLYDHYKLNWPLLDKKRTKPGSRVNRSYFLTMTFKYVALLIASQRNDFSTSHYIWIDFGCSHVAPTDYIKNAKALLDNPRPKVGICYIHYRTNNELLDSSLFCNKGACGTAGGIISVEGSYMVMLYARYMRIFYEHIEKNIWHSDEQIMTYCLHRHPELFDYYYGDYKSLLVNYHEIKMDWHHIRWYFIENALIDNNFTKANDCIKKILESFKKGYFKLSGTDLNELNKLLGEK